MNGADRSSSSDLLGRMVFHVVAPCELREGCEHHSRLVACSIVEEWGVRDDVDHARAY